MYKNLISISAGYLAYKSATSYLKDGLILRLILYEKGHALYFVICISFKHRLRKSAHGK